MSPPAHVPSGSTSPLTDHHAHWFPPELLSLLARRDDPPFAREAVAGWTFTAALRPRPLTPLASDLNVRADLLSSLGIGRQTLSLSTLWNIDSLPLDAALPLMQAFNDATAGAIARLSMYEGLAAVPAADVDVACDEMNRAADLGLRGVVLSAGQFATRSQTDRWAPLFVIANARQLRVFIHPGYAPFSADAQARGDDSAGSRQFGLDPQHQIGAAMLTLSHSGWLAAFPDVIVQFANLGGSYTFACERLERMGQSSPAMLESRRGAMNHVVVDSASFGPQSIRCASSLLGASAVVFGTDMPIFEASRAVKDWHAAMGLAQGNVPGLAKITSGIEEASHPLTSINR